MAAQPINEKSIHNRNCAAGLRLLLRRVLQLAQWESRGITSGSGSVSHQKRGREMTSSLTLLFLFSFLFLPHFLSVCLSSLLLFLCISKWRQGDLSTIQKAIFSSVFHFLFRSFLPLVIPGYNLPPFWKRATQGSFGSMNIQFWHKRESLFSPHHIYTYSPFPLSPPLHAPMSELYITYPNTFTFINTPFSADQVLYSPAMFQSVLQAVSRTLWRPLTYITNVFIEHRHSVIGIEPT